MKKQKSDTPELERRRWPRLKPSSIPFLKEIHLSQGSEVQAIDISRGGMLLETEVRLRPQMRVHLKLVTSEGLIEIEGSVLRSSIASLQGIPRYRSAIVFSKPFHLLGEFAEEPGAKETEPKPEVGTAPLVTKENGTPPGQPIPGKFDEGDATLTFFVQDFPGTSLLEMFKLNDW